MNSPRIEALERQIEATRRSLDRTLHDLQFKLSPRRQAAQAVRWMTRSPVPGVLLVVGIAAVAYLRATRERRRGS